MRRVKLLYDCFRNSYETLNQHYRVMTRQSRAASLGLDIGKLPTDCLQLHKRERVHYHVYSNEPLSVLVPER